MKKAEEIAERYSTTCADNYGVTCVERTVDDPPPAPGSMAQLFRAAVNEAFEVAARECEKAMAEQSGLSGYDGEKWWDIREVLADRIRAMKSE